MKLSITKPKPKLLKKSLSEELTPKLLEAFLETKGLYCQIKLGNGYFLYNDSYGFYDFKVITRYGVGTGYEIYQDARQDLADKIQTIASDQNWNVHIDKHFYAQERFNEKETGIMVWLYASDNG